ncbi:hypothetical protein LMG19089_04963 [Ralstonia edaphis]|nr:hypothetical protein LMG19089_04963 [Ralstonia sp. LMG 6871]
MKAKRMAGGALLACALVAGWLIVARPWTSDSSSPVGVDSAVQGDSLANSGDKKVSAPGPSRTAATAAQPAQSSVVAVTDPRPVTGGPRAYGYGVMDENGQVIPPPRPVVMTEVRPGMPENEATGTERGHDRGPNFNLGLYRQADGSVYRP